MTSLLPAPTYSSRAARSFPWVVGRGLVLLLAVSVGTQLQAQIAEYALIMKLDYYDQTSSARPPMLESAIYVEVDFPTTPVPAVTVQLIKPSGTSLPLTRNSDGYFSFEQEFVTEAALIASFPDGTYQLKIAGGGSDNTISVAYSNSGSIPAPRITNFEALQAVTTSNAEVKWESISVGGDDDFLFIELYAGDGTLISSSDDISARATSTTLAGVPLGDSSGNLAYLRYFVSPSSTPATSVYTGKGFFLSFPLRRVAASVPNAPLSAGAYASGSNEVTLTWQPPAGTNLVTSYRIERAPDSGFSSGSTYTVNGALTSYIDQTAVPGTSYYYRIAATNTSGTSVTTPPLLVTTPSVAGTGSTRFVNIATRAHCGIGNSVTIGGFVVSGSQSKRVLVRAVGPSLVAQGIGATEVLTDPSIEVYRGASVVARNDDVGQNANAAELITVGSRIGASALLASDTKSSALLLDLSPGVYSFVVSGKNASSGIVLLEVYDADAVATGSTFVNIATRANSQPGNGVTIGGFVIAGGASKKVLLRAVGPSLTASGLGAAEVLMNPVIELYRGSPVIATNDNWATNANAAEIVSAATRIGAAPLAASDANSSALLLKLPPGVYSFIARGANATSGIVLVEVYDAD